MELQSKELKWIKTGTDEYEKMLVLREDILRKPLGQTLDRSALKEEEACLLTVWNGEMMIGAMVLKEEDPNTARMMQVAVH